ncbi:response regulator transcription factor [Corynebacterium sp.]|uniref:response regulator n=1 Tax=Corynebacterium sp. TaxID=1720 RepID=UPI0026DAD656|nr:response regulator transcription factor [Corynebacterium sp.]MDO5077209.1 response regulator transcription factor [Corynebacterium sp.]
MCSETATAIRVLVVDNDPLAISTIKRYLSCENDINIIDEAENGFDALDKLKHHTVDIVLAAIRMPSMSGISLLQEMQMRHISANFIAMTALDSDTNMIEVLKGGGSGYIVKSSTPRELCTAIRNVADGGVAVSPKPLSRLVSYISEAHPNPPQQSPVARTYETLNPMEKKVLENLCCGKSNAEIARTLQYSQATVKKYISSLIAQFHASSRLDLAILVIESGVIAK